MVINKLLRPQSLPASCCRTAAATSTSMGTYTCDAVRRLKSAVDAVRATVAQLRLHPPAGEGRRRGARRERAKVGDGRVRARPARYE